MIDISDLPYEIILEIFDYLADSDKISFLSVFPKFCNKSLKQFSQHINLSRQFGLQGIDRICSNLSQIYDLSNITSFNINSLYWIPEDDLLKCVSQMKNLHTLLVLDTKLNLVETHCEIYKRLPLEKVALTLDPERVQQDVFFAFPNVKKLCLKYGNKQLIVSFLINSLSKHHDLEELVLIEKGEGIEYIPGWVAIVLELRIILKCKRFVFKFETETDSPYDLRYLRSFLKEYGYRVCYISHMLSNSKSGTYHELICYKNKDALDFDVENCVGVSTDSSELASIYLHKHNENGALVVQCVETTRLGDSDVYNIFKRLPNLYKLEVYECNLSDLNYIDGIKTYLKDLQELRVYNCCCEKSRYNADSENTVPKYELVSQFRNLRKLFMEISFAEDLIILYDNTSILAMILKNCQYLESLHIVALNKNENVENVANMALDNLKYARNLKEFSFNIEGELSIFPLLETLTNMEAKLERIYLKAQNVIGVRNKSDIAAKMHSYIVNNSQLSLFMIDLDYNPYDIKSFGNKRYYQNHLVPDDIKTVHADLLTSEANSGFNVFGNF